MPTTSLPRQVTILKTAFVDMYAAVANVEAAWAKRREYAEAIGCTIVHDEVQCDAQQARLMALFWEVLEREYSL